MNEVGFCPVVSGVLSYGVLSVWGFVLWGFVSVGFCPCGVLSVHPRMNDLNKVLTVTQWIGLSEEKVYHPKNLCGVACKNETFCFQITLLEIKKPK